MRNFMIGALVVIGALIYAVALYAAIAVPEQGLEPFIIMTLAMLCLIPHYIRRFFTKNGREEAKHVRDTSHVKFWSKKSILYVIASGAIAILLSFVPELTTKEVIGIFIGGLMAFLIVDFFVFYLPKKLGWDD